MIMKELTRQKQGVSQTDLFSAPDLELSMQLCGQRYASWPLHTACYNILDQRAL